MKIHLNLFLILCVVCNSVFGTCDWTQIKKNADNTYTYTEALHLCVGNLVQDNKVKEQQISDLTQAISLKDLTIQKSDARANMWMDTSVKLEDRFDKVESMQKTNTLLTIGGTVLAVVLVGSMTARLIGR